MAAKPRVGNRERKAVKTWDVEFSQAYLSEWPIRVLKRLKTRKPYKSDYLALIFVRNPKIAEVTKGHVECPESEPAEDDI